jgi:hypothetical protein
MKCSMPGIRAGVAAAGVRQQQLLNRPQRGAVLVAGDREATRSDRSGPSRLRSALAMNCISPQQDLDD